VGGTIFGRITHGCLKSPANNVFIKKKQQILALRADSSCLIKILLLMGLKDSKKGTKRPFQLLVSDFACDFCEETYGVMKHVLGATRRL
jgi:hypothetical protein